MGEEGVAQRRLADARLALDQHHLGARRRAPARGRPSSTLPLGVAADELGMRPRRRAREPPTWGAATSGVASSAGSWARIRLSSVRSSGPGSSPSSSSNDAARRRQRPQRVGLPARPVQGQRQQRPQPLPQAAARRPPPAAPAPPRRGGRAPAAPRSGPRWRAPAPPRTARPPTAPARRGRRRPAPARATARARRRSARAPAPRTRRRRRARASVTIAVKRCTSTSSTGTRST